MKKQNANKITCAQRSLSLKFKKRKNWMPPSEQRDRLNKEEFVDVIQVTKSYISTYTIRKQLLIELVKSTTFHQLRIFSFLVQKQTERICFLYLFIDRRGITGGEIKQSLEQNCEHSGQEIRKLKNSYDNRRFSSISSAMKEIWPCRRTA